MSLFRFRSGSLPFLLFATCKWRSCLNLFLNDSQTFVCVESLHLICWQLNTNVKTTSAFNCWCICRWSLCLGALPHLYVCHSLTSIESLLRRQQNSRIRTYMRKFLMWETISCRFFEQASRGHFDLSSVHDSYFNCRDQPQCLQM